MDNPLKLPAPKEVIQQIHTLARDLAYGVITGLWSAKFYVMPAIGRNGEDWLGDDVIFEDDTDSLSRYLVDKWNDTPPRAYLMRSFEYFTISEVRDSGQINYLLTQKAFDLLQQPATLPSVFISYRQDQSSALGLLIEARLKIADSNAHIFIDKLLIPGDDWEKRLQDTIRQSRYFVCLLGAETLARSKMVYQEIQWAADAGCTMIAVCHGGYTIDALCPPELSRKQAIIIRQESAEEYELAMIKLLNSLGYSTY